MMALTRSRTLPLLVGSLFLGSILAVPAAAERPAAGSAASPGDRAAAWEQRKALLGASLFEGLSWRSIGPTVQGGRVVDIESVPGKPYSFLVAYASGGLWRTDNNGATFEPLFDQQPLLIMGDIAIDPQLPDRIWVGTGENNSSRSTYGGMGMFRSDDGGKTWHASGLAQADRIGRVLVDPRDSNRIYVAAQGKLYTPGGERGLFRSTDGGASWQLMLDTGKDGWTGVIDLAMDPNDSKVLYAAAWERSRAAWNFVEAGAGSGIYKSTDGGDTWTRLGGGLPQGENVGRIGLAIAASKSSTLYASIDNQELLPEADWDLGDGAVTPKRLRKMSKDEFLAQDLEAIEDFIRDNDLPTELDAKTLIGMLEKGEITLEDLLAVLDDANANLFNSDIRGLEVYRSDDAGATWRRTHEQPIREVVYTYGYYFGQIRVSPDDPERVYCVGVPAIQSKDGGKTWQGMNGPDVHVDYHAQWIDPTWSQRMILGNDGGLDASYDGGKTWVKLDNQALGQFYAITVDMEEPYNVYGGLQDNGSLKGSSQSRPGRDPWQFIGGGDGMQVQVDPRDNTLYAGFQFGYYFRRGPSGPPTMVRPRGVLKEPALRYNWQTPILLSSHNPDVFYFGANKLFRSMDQGETWTAISPDLTVAKERGDVPFATLTTLSESKFHFGLLWVGTDDGQVRLSPDGGVTWSDVAGGLSSGPDQRGLPKDRWVSRVEASRHVKERAYVSLNGYRNDDIGAYLYVTEDLGKTWTSLAAGLPAEPINVVREDPVNADVLYVGSDRGVYVSLDRGKAWQALAQGMPNVSVHDLVVHPRDRELVAGTHGRSIYVIDALPIQELPKLVADAEEQVEVFPLENVAFQRYLAARRSPWFHDPLDDPKVEIPFYTAQDGKATLTIRDADGRALRTQELTARRGVAVFSWDLLLDPKLALDAEKARLAADAKKGDKAKDGKGKKGKAKDAKAEAAKIEKGAKAKEPWAEAVRLERPVYATPATYTVEVAIGDAKASTELVIDPPSPREPRQKAKMKIRGQRDDDESGKD
jgi:photosystem II stability/assembly factor-like uncharacterized protein